MFVELLLIHCSKGISIIIDNLTSEYWKYILYLKAQTNKQSPLPYLIYTSDKIAISKCSHRQAIS